MLAALVGGLGVAVPAAAAAAPADVAAAPAEDRHTARTVHRDAPDQGFAPEVASCQATVVIAGQWSGGFVGQVTVRNTGTVPIRWQVTLTFPGATINPPPGYIVLPQGASWLISPPKGSWNGILPVGASTTFGFTGTTTGSLGTPTATCAATPA